MSCQEIYLFCDRVVINLKSGATFSFPPALAQGLADASPEDLAEVEVTPSGDGLRWEKLDADFSVPALLAGVLDLKERNCKGFSPIQRANVPNWDAPPYPATFHAN
ncbi:MAG: DUF2442 domain-containing protein [Coleofasciculus sp. C1-SOL-03]|uniref:DUF2442 domain-containing protein n=1 Tax=Coleofasciculus sp. C1-SOL-03 TaxID=3069522 RepID=UPI0032F817C5